MANATRKAASSATAAPKAAAKQAPQKEEPQTEEQKQKTESDLRREAYTAATTRLREEQQGRFRELVLEEAQKRNVTYEFRKTAEEKAAEQVAALLAAHPELRAKFQEVTPASEVGTEQPYSDEVEGTHVQS